ncbi:MAG TPA: DUF6062 family protein [bacterium]|nr:DUF6062 family protein [bacterium]
MPPFFDPDRFLEILRPDRCPLCYLIHDYGQTYLRNLLEESVTDPHTRDRLLASRGFCRRHAWHAVGQAQALGMAVLYAHLLKDGLKRAGPPKRWWGKKERCEVCEAEAELGSVQAGQFAAAWSHSAQLREAFEARGLFCLPHLEKTLAKRMPAARRAHLKRAAEKALQPLLKDLGEFLEKQDYHRSKEAMGPEWDAWIRAVRAVAGERD